MASDCLQRQWPNRNEGSAASRSRDIAAPSFRKPYEEATLPSEVINSHLTLNPQPGAGFLPRPLLPSLSSPG